MSGSCRLIVDGPASGSWNMAVDEALLEGVATRGEPALRFYAWTPATLSLGYFQSYTARVQHSPSATCPAVRRRSGGGAIMHDAEITYGLVLPVAHSAARDPMTLYQAVHQGVIQVLRDWGLEAEAYSGKPKESDFLCFHRCAVGDLIVASHKVLGSAQRRSKSGVLQHGSLLLRRSKFAPSLPGILDLGGSPPHVGEIIPELAAGIAATLGMTPRPERLDPMETAMAEQAAEARFAAERWTRKR